MPDPATVRRDRGRSPVLRTSPGWFGDRAALVLDPDGRLLAVWALDIAGGAIRGVASIVNPDTLRHIAAVGSMRDALASLRARPSPDR